MMQLRIIIEENWSVISNDYTLRAISNINSNKGRYNLPLLLGFSFLPFPRTMTIDSIFHSLILEEKNQQNNNTLQSSSFPESGVLNLVVEQ